MEPGHSGTTVAAPLRSAPTPAEGIPSSLGRICRVVGWLDAHKGAFAISRLILQTGIKLRDHGPTTRDDPRDLAKLMVALDALLTAEERAQVRAAVGG